MENPLSRFKQPRRYTAIPFKVMLYIAWKNLVSKKLRAFLTIMGIIIGIGSIFFLLSFGLGLQRLVTDEIIGDQSVQSIEISSPNSRIIKIDESGASRIQGLPHVKRTSLIYTFPGSMKLSGSESDTIVYGIDPEYQSMTSLRLVAGRLLEKDDTRVVFVNKAALSSVGINNENEALDKDVVLTIPLQQVDAAKKQIVDEYKIVGVIDSGSGSEIFIPRFSFEAAGVSVYSQMKVLADDTQNVAGLRRQIESLGYETSSPTDTIEQINQIFDFFNLILVSFGAIGMIVAVLGMFNTLTVALLERTREIGLMIAMGARNYDMRRLFILEALLLSLFGATLGIVFAYGAGQFINVVMNNFARGRGVTQTFHLFSTPVWLIAVMIGFMILVGLLVVYLPARRAQKISPIDALRRE